jgi:hypothetical protein
MCQPSPNLLFVSVDAAAVQRRQQTHDHVYRQCETRLP